MKKFYDKEGLTDYQAKRYTEGNFFANRIKDEIITIAKKKINDARGYNMIDIGSAEGLYLKEINNKGISLCLDLSYPKLKRASEKTNGLVMNYYVTADAEYLPLRQGIFNGVICSEVLEHLPDPEKAIKEITYIIRKNGTLFLSVPTGKDRMRPIAVSTEPNYMTESGHLHEFSKKEIRQLLEKNGFHVQHEITIDVLGEIRRLLNKLFRNFKVNKRISKMNNERKDSRGPSASNMAKKFLKRLYSQSWMCLDMVLSKIPILRRKGHFAIFVAEKLS